jgi:hypothetical protein
MADWNGMSIPFESSQIFGSRVDFSSKVYFILGPSDAIQLTCQFFLAKGPPGL